MTDHKKSAVRNSHDHGYPHAGRQHPPAGDHANFCNHAGELPRIINWDEHGNPIPANGKGRNYQRPAPANG